MLLFHDANGLRHFLMIQAIKELAEYNTKKYSLTADMTREESYRIKTVITDVHDCTYYATETVDELLQLLMKRNTDEE